ncbi:MAG: DUF2145 domain-containing protein [Saezia sp.]
MLFANRGFKLLILLTSMLMLGSCTWATRYICNKNEVSLEKTVALMPVATTFSQWLDQTGAELVVAARRGQNFDRYGFEFSHAAFIKKEADGWFAYHLLNICPSDRGGLFKEGMVNFVAPATQNYRIAVVIPEADIQRKLAILLDSKTERDSVFDAHYNASAYPFSTGTQNSNGWLLEFFSKAIADKPIHNRVDAIAWLKQDGYEPALIEAGKIKQLFTIAILPQMSTYGHPDEDAIHNRFWINSADAALRYVSRYSIVPTCKQKSDTLGEKICIFQYTP